jgi:hypothetical protein
MFLETEHGIATGGGSESKNWNRMDPIMGTVLNKSMTANPQVVPPKLEYLRLLFPVMNENLRT